MNIFFDTNVLISAFNAHGSCADIFEYCLNNHQVLVSDFVLKEIKKALTIKFKYSKNEREEVLDFLKMHTSVVSIQLPKEKISRDRTDDNILAAADKSEAVFLVTGDMDLLILKKYREVSIISPKDFWEHVQ